MNAPDASLLSLVSAANEREAQSPVSALFMRRWSARGMTGEKIPEEVLQALFEAARFAPSSYNSQPWRFAYARRGSPAFDLYVDALWDANKLWAREASALILVASKAKFTPPGKDAEIVSRTASFDAGAAWASLAYQAAILGWSTRAMGGFDLDKARAAAKAPNSLNLEVIVAVGKRAETASVPEAIRQIDHPNNRRPVAASAFENDFPEQC